MKLRQELLEDAIQLITRERNAEYGEPTQDFDRTAAMLNALGYRAGEADILPHDVAMIQICLKLSRLAWAAEKRDTWADIAGYAGCGWECVTEEEEEE